ncbi:MULTISPECIES: fimbrial protein [Enterobacter cloacae complex]|uniref:fimbrial protein n=1 Tax=Enterobacter cloacae complex TaxID=354276 RepID=UPI0030763752
MRMQAFLLVTSCMLISSVMPSLAGNTLFGWGVVNMQGAIIETACAIAVESQNQSIEMGVVPLSDIVRDGQGSRKYFSIELINCVVERQDAKKPDWKKFNITFDGDSDGNFFRLSGDASGVALKITDKHGNAAFPGQPLMNDDIHPGDMKLQYQLFLVANQKALKAGDFFSSVRFKLDYF